MRTRTIATLEHLESAKWFANVGIRDVKTPIVLNSWKEAIDACGSPEWKEINLEMANQLSEKLSNQAPDRFTKWNEIVKECKEKTIPLISKKTESVVKINSLPKSFLNAVNWDILHICLEAEFSDSLPLGYFASQGFWYIKGHFPCGWRGKFPQGQLVVY